MVASLTRVGTHTAAGRRSSNQDAVVAVALPNGRELVCVADGMGGHRAGEVASRRAIDVLVERLKAGASLRDAIAAANDAVHAAARTNSAWAGMGTTVVALLRSDSGYVIANVGDSRAYRITSTSIQQITHDHSVTAEAIAKGHMSRTQAERSQWKHALTRAIGTDPTVEIDTFGPFDATSPHKVLLCSDGLYASVGEDRIRRCVEEAPDPDSAAQRLTEEAFRNGSTDNISAAVIVFAANRSTSAPRPLVGPVSMTGRRVIVGPRRARQRSILGSIVSLFHGFA